MLRDNKKSGNNANAYIILETAFRIIYSLVVGDSQTHHLPQD
jgi:hypothetical protein